jgi:hypothetical protein
MCFVIGINGRVAELVSGVKSTDNFFVWFKRKYLTWKICDEAGSYLDLLTGFEISASVF